MNHIVKKGIRSSLVLLSAATLFSCGNNPDNPGLEYAPDMYYSVPLEALSQVKAEAYNPHGMNMRVPASNTIARGKLGLVENIAKDSAEIAGRKLTNPLQMTTANLEEGKVLYNRFCAHCHGETGVGDGLVGEKFKGVPNYSVGRYATLPAGHIYWVIANGRGRMMPHGSQLNHEERWKVTMYVQQLQKGPDAANAPLTTTEGQGAATEGNTNQPAGTNANPQQ